MGAQRGPPGTDLSGGPRARAGHQLDNLSISAISDTYFD